MKKIFFLPFICKLKSNSLHVFQYSKTVKNANTYDILINDPNNGIY